MMNSMFPNPDTTVDGEDIDNTQVANFFPPQKGDVFCVKSDNDRRVQVQGTLGIVGIPHKGM